MILKQAYGSSLSSLAIHTLLSMYSGRIKTLILDNIVSIGAEEMPVDLHLTGNKNDPSIVKHFVEIKDEW